MNQLVRIILNGFVDVARIVEGRLEFEKISGVLFLILEINIFNRSVKVNG